MQERPLCNADLPAYRPDPNVGAADILTPGTPS
jgi:hypothetical protein